MIIVKLKRIMKKDALVMRFKKFCDVMENVDSTTSKNEKIDIFASFIKELKITELAFACYYATAQAFPKKKQLKMQMGGKSVYSTIKELTSRTNKELNEFYKKKADFGSLVEWALMKQKFRPTSLNDYFGEYLAKKNLSIAGLNKILTEMSSYTGKGSLQRRKMTLLNLLRRTSPLEAKYIARIITSDTRTGFQEGLLLESIAIAFVRDKKHVRYANMVLGDVGEVALAAKDQILNLMQISPQLFNPLRSMLATKVETVEEALNSFSPIICEQKIDGFRAQIHISKKEIKIYSRNLENITEAFPEILSSFSSVIRKIIAPCILDGEIVAFIDNKPVFFQDILKRIQRKVDIDVSATIVPVHFFIFDIILFQGKSLIHTILEKRKEVLKSIKFINNVHILSYSLTSEIERINTLYDEAIKGGYEGLMLKDPKSLYLAGKRGNSWLKIKATLPTLDLVIIGAEWGHGRRTGWLSNYHLAARDKNDFQIIGKTYKGLTDNEFHQITEELLSLTVSKESYGIQVQPKIIVEVEFDNIQESSKYPSGMALRFARIKRIRFDKTLDDVDTINNVQRLYKSQLQRQSRATKT